MITEENHTEFVSEELFNETIEALSSYRNEKEKPLWTRQRIEETIIAIEQFRLAPILKTQRTSKQYYYAQKYEVMEEGTTKSLILKRKLESDSVIKIVSTEEFYTILREIHQSTGHGGRDKMLFTLKTRYLIPTSVVLEFSKLCTVCQSKKEFPKKGIGVNVRPNVSKAFNNRGQVDFVDLRSTPYRNYKWLLHYQDHATKFSFLRPLISKGAAEVALELLKIFLQVGCPHILQSDNGREFTAAVIKELASLWPTCKILNGRPGLSSSLGSVERSNEDIKAMLSAWLDDNSTKNWTLGCYFVQLQKNSAFNSTIKRSPYKALFGREPKTGLGSTHIPADELDKLVTEEDLDQYLKQKHNIDNSTTTAESIVCDVSMSDNLPTTAKQASPSLVKTKRKPEPVKDSTSSLVWNGIY